MHASAERDNSSNLRAPTPQPVTVTFLFSHPATTEIYTLSLHDALPIFNQGTIQFDPGASNVDLIIQANAAAGNERRNEHTAEVHGPDHLVDLHLLVTKTGTLQVTSGTLNLRGAFTNTNLGNLNHTGASV